MAMAAVAASSTIRARLTYMNYQHELEERSAARLANRPSLSRCSVYRAPREATASPAWSNFDDETLIASARASGDGAVHWGDVANAVHRSSGVVCTAAECKARYSEIAPTSLLAEARARPSFFARLTRRFRGGAPPQAVGVATPCDADDGTTPLPKGAGYRG